MKFKEEILPGCFVIEPVKFKDHRGVFVKTFHELLFKEAGVVFETREEFYSVSTKDTLRGMHFQIPPHDHDKLVYCTRGRVLDVLLDLRAGPSFGKSVSVELSAENMLELFIPKGIAHGFLSLSDESLMLYKTSTFHNPQYDRGIRWNSFGFDWGLRAPITSKRDDEHPEFAAFETPFTLDAA
jgi:dTDP-4-dehydrorhamnose 3,5-epimerase/CDP-3, 6-dideoxy-D-glycero-D-glycero-4-hexulose-5-epimerase